MKLKKFTINQFSTLREAMRLIEENQHGLILITTTNDIVFGLATDGDIRRHLLKGGSIEDTIELCANKDFIYANAQTPRELILKKLDSTVKALPLLNEKMILTGLLSKDNLPIQSEGTIYTRAVAPVRISLSGGGSDLTHYFSSTNCGAVINSSISLFTHATLRMRDDAKIKINSLDLEKSLSVDNLESISPKNKSFGLINSVIRSINPRFGFELYLNSDFPLGSGLGGSAAVSASILGCFNQFRRDSWNRYELAELAYQAERHYLGIAGGWQDQYASVFGGFNFMEFRMDKNIIHPLRIDKNTLAELEECLILCDTGIAHESGQIHLDQEQNMSEAEVKKFVDKNVELSYEIRDNLLLGKLSQLGTCLDKAWQLKRKLSKKISSPSIDKIYSDAKLNGATGGKLLGAGGGGFFLFYSLPHQKYKLITHLKTKGLNIKPFRFEQDGLKSWSVRENG